MKTNNNGVDAELKSKTLKAARKAYFTRKYVRVASVSAACVAVIFAAAIFLPANKPFLDNTLETATATDEQKVFVDENIPLDEPLTIFTDEMINEALIAQYNQIDGVRKISNPYTIYGKTPSEYEEVLIKEIASGAGPDIVYFLGHLKSMQSLAQAGYFADMNKIINVHPDFDLNDYNTDVLNSVLIDDNRYYFPLYYYTKYHLSTQEKFDKLGLTVPDTLNMASYFELVEAFYNSVPTDQPVTYGQLLNNIVDSVLIGGQLSKDPQTEKYFELLKEESKRTEYKSDYTIAPSPSSEYGYFGDRINNYFSFDYLFFTGDQLSNPETLYDYFRKFEEKMLSNSDTDSVILFVDTLNPGGITTGYTIGNLAINSNSRLKNEAFNFIEYMLSEEVQSLNYNLSGLAPVNKIAYALAKNNMLKTAEADGKIELATEIINIIENVEKFKETLSYPNVIYENEEFQKYFDGKATFDEMVDSVNRDLEEWFYENP